MKSISYFKLQSKNLLRDYRVFMADGDAYQFFDINRIVTDYKINIDDDFTLMRAQHTIAKMIGFDSWDELIRAPESVLAHKMVILDSIGVKIKPQKIFNIELSKHEPIGPAGAAGDYLVKCPKSPDLAQIVQMEPNCYFLSVDCSNLDEWSADPDHFYVNIVPKTATIRVLVPGTKFPDWYAVEVKNIN